MAKLVFPTLYMVTKLGKTKLWKVSVKGDVFTRQDYFVDGKVKSPVTRKCETTNEGRANERNPHEQACFEAARAWIRSLERGYAPEESDEKGMELYKFVMSMKEKGETNHNLPVLLVKRARGEKAVDVVETQSGIRTIKSTKKVVKATGKAKAVITKVIKPMLAFDLKDRKKSFKPSEEVWYIQPKLDGIRCIARNQYSKDTTAVLTTRTGKLFAHLSHLYRSVRDLLETYKDRYKEELILDGELYAESIRQVTADGTNIVLGVVKFNLISGACRPNRFKPAPYEEQISYYVFDVVDTKRVQSERVEVLKRAEKLWRKISDTNHLVFLPYERVEDMSTVKEKHTKWIEEGYEGVILRKDEVYSYTRSANLLKYKEFEDFEYEIVGATEGEGTEKGCVVWKCVTDSGKEFNVRPQGTLEDRKFFYENRDDYIGKFLTVRYQDKSDDDVPRIFAGVGIRDYE